MGTVIIVLVAVVVVAVAGIVVLFARRRTRVREGNRAQARADLQQAQQLALRADSEHAAARMQLGLAQRERALAEQRATHLEEQAQEKIRQAETGRAEATALHQHAHEVAPDVNDPSWQPPTQRGDADAAPQQQPAWRPPQTPTGPPPTGSPARDRPAPPPLIAAPAGEQPPPAAASPVQPLPGQLPPAPAQPNQPPPGFDSRGQLRRTRAGGIWVGLIASAIVLIVLLVFILQNSQTVVIHFLGFTGHLSFAVTVLIAAVSGLLLVAVPGTVRILELGRALKKTARPGTPATTASPQPGQPPS